MTETLSSEPLYIPPAVQPPDQPLPYLKAMWRLLDNPIEAWPRAVYEDPWFRRRSNGQTFVYVTDPDALKAILLDEAAAFPKDWVFRRIVGPAFGAGLLTSEGAEWRWQRRAAAPAFRADHVAEMTPAMVASAEAALARWGKLGAAPRLDLAHEMTRITFDVIRDTMLSGGEGIDVETASRRISDYLDTLGRVTPADLVNLPMWARQALSPRGRQAVLYLRKMVDRMVLRRRRQPARGDLVDLLMAARDTETGRKMDDVLLRDNLLTFIGAGHETTALALTWALFLVGNHPRTEQRILDEVAAVAGEDSLTAQHVDRLAFTRQVVQEALRLYPPLPIMTRMCARDVDAGGLKVEAGSFIFIPIYALHRHRQLWRDPDAFDPDRFGPEEQADRRRFAYMPFGGGPRICIGQGFAMTEAVAILATLVRGASFAPDPAHRIRPLLRISMRPEGGLPAVVRLRGAQASPDGTTR